MQFNLKVKVLKKSKDARYPEHIIVERKSTHEMVHMYFNEGTLTKFTHIVRDPQIKMAWDDKEKRYKVLLPSYKVAQEFTIKDGKSTFLMGPQNNDFFGLGFSASPITNSRTLGFKSSPDAWDDFFIEMDLAFKCKPIYIQDYGVADVKMVYPHQKRKAFPTKLLLPKMFPKSK